VVSGPFPTTIGLCAVLEVPWHNVLVILDCSRWMSTSRWSRDSGCPPAAAADRGGGILYLRSSVACAPARSAQGQYVMQQQASSSPHAHRAVPTRPAAIALLLLDAALLIIPLFVRWQSWFAFAYIPLLFTVAWGVMLGRIWKWPAVMLFTAVLLVFVVVGVALVWPGRSLDRFGYALISGLVVLVCVGIVTVCLAIRGWVKFFSGRAAASPANAADRAGTYNR